MPSLPDTLRTTAARCPDRVALVFNGRSRTYREFAAAVEQCAAVLAERGVRLGDRVVVMSANSDEFVVGAFAVLRAGAILVPSNPSNAAPELVHLLADSGAVLVLHDAGAAEVAAAAVADVGRPVDVVGLAELERLGARCTSTPPAWPAESDDALLLYTSGTTGSPKGALFDHHRALWCGVNAISTCGLREADRTVHVAPLYHAAALCLVLLPGVALAMTQHVLPSFDPATLVDTLERKRITVFFGVPTMYRFLLRVPGIADRDLSAWRVGMFGAAPMPADTVTALSTTLPSVDLFQLCGQTEAGPGGIYAGPDDVRRRPDASGRYALPNTEMRIVDGEGADIAPGGVGELLLRGETLMKGYWNRPEETATTITDGWLHTGDLAQLDEDGYVTLVDRLKDMIITGGRNVYSVEVENALAGHPDVTDVAVVGVPHPDYGESIVAVVVPTQGASPSLGSLREWGGTRLSRYKLPHDLRIGTIPRNPSGKIQKHVLRAWLRT